MGPRNKRFWLPLTRLGAFFAVVVVAGNVVLYAFRPATPELPSSSDDAVDYYSRKRRRIERQIQRTLELLWGPSRAASREIKAGMTPPSLPVRSVLSVVTATEAPPPPLPIVAPAPRANPAPKPELLGYFEPAPPPFVWPAISKPEVLPEVELPVSLGYEGASNFRSKLVTEIYRKCAPDPVADVGDAILKTPEFLIDGIFTCAKGMGDRPATRVWDDDRDCSMMSRILSVEIGPRTNTIWAEFMNQFTNREMAYLGDFNNSRVDTVQFEDRTDAADNHELMLEQRKVFLDALRRTYLSRYKIQADERLREQAWYLDRWKGADYLILPPLMGAYVFYRGLDRKFTIGPSKLQLSIEPVSEWYRTTKHDLPAALAMDWTMKGCPLGVIVSAGLHGGRYGLDFVGIGTSLGAVRRALVMQEFVPQGVR